MEEARTGPPTVAGTWDPGTHGGHIACIFLRGPIACILLHDHQEGNDLLDQRHRHFFLSHKQVYVSICLHKWLPTMLSRILKHLSLSTPFHHLFGSLLDPIHVSSNFRIIILPTSSFKVPVTFIYFITG